MNITKQLADALLHARENAAYDTDGTVYLSVGEEWMVEAHLALAAYDKAMARRRRWSLVPLPPQVWRCTRARMDDGGTATDTKYATTPQELIILRDQGYTCTLLEGE